MRVLGKGEYSGDVVRRRDLGGAIVSATRYRNTEASCAWHSHENAHLSLVFEGGRSEARSRALDRQTPGIFFYPAGERHRWVSPGRVSKSANIELDASYLTGCGVRESDVGTAIDQNPAARFLILAVLKEALSDDPLDAESARFHLLELLGNEAWNPGTRTPTWMPTLAEILQDRWNETVTLRELAAALRVHPVTISKSFRKHFACSLAQYRRRLKVERSLALIKESRWSLTEIALHCGFADQSHFTRAFKELTRFSPKEFREL